MIIEWESREVQPDRSPVGGAAGIQPVMQGVSGGQYTDIQRLVMSSEAIGKYIPCRAAEQALPSGSTAKPQHCIIDGDVLQGAIFGKERDIGQTIQQARDLIQSHRQWGAALRSRGNVNFRRAVPNSALAMLSGHKSE